jgi:mannitol-1-phosphate 5-dehydrogenase
MKSGEALQIGAGNIGRALVGDVMSDAGMQITFADVNQELIDAINSEGGYPIDVVSLDGTNTKYIDGIEAISSLDEKAMIERIVNADIVTTAVGASILPRIAPTLAKGLAERMTRRPSDELHVVVIACENMEKNTEALRDHILAALPDNKVRKAVLENVSFPNAAVDRIVPNNAGASAHPLIVITEDYFQLAIDASGLMSDMPKIGSIEVVDDLEAVLAQKLFTLNGAHAAAAYWGYLRGYKTIDQAMSDADIEALVAGLMTEVSGILTSNYPSITPEAQKAFTEKVSRRFLNPYLKDEPSRVGREPKRKLSQSDRLIRPALLAIEGGDIPANLGMAIVGGFRFDNPNDTQSREIAHGIETEGIDAAVVAVTGLHASHPLVRTTVAGYRLGNLVSK